MCQTVIDGEYYQIRAREMEFHFDKVDLEYNVLQGNPSHFSMTEIQQCRFLEEEDVWLGEGDWEIVIALADIISIKLQKFEINLEPSIASLLTRIHPSKIRSIECSEYDFYSEALSPYIPNLVYLEYLYLQDYMSKLSKLADWKIQEIGTLKITEPFKIQELPALLKKVFIGRLIILECEAISQTDWKYLLTIIFESNRVGALEIHDS